MISESPRNIPLEWDVDIVVVGGSSGAVAAAVEAARLGCRVFLAALRPYLGEDICSPRRFWIEESENPETPLSRQLYENAKQTGVPPTPMHIKRVLDQALIQARVPFLFGCYPTDVLRDIQGRPAGVVLANRGGRQAVRAKWIIDATPRSVVARMAGAVFSPYSKGDAPFRRIVVGGMPGQEASSPARKTGTRYVSKGQAFDVFEYQLDIFMKDGSFPSFAEAEQIARDRTWQAGQVDASDTLYQIPPDFMRGIKHIGDSWPGAARADLDAFRPESVERLFVLGPCADLSRKSAEQIMRPVELLALGAQLGIQAAKEARALPVPEGVHLPGADYTGRDAGEVREFLLGTRPYQRRESLVPSESRALPILGEYDVIVAGGGTGGAPAAIAAAHEGAKTLVLEYLHGLGGVGTLGLIASYYHGYRKGFTDEVTNATGEKNWDIEAKMEWWRKEIRNAGGKIWFGCLCCGALVEEGRIKGVIVATPQGRGVVLGRVVIDATGNADVAAAAGARCVYTNETPLAVQGSGLPPRNLGRSYCNTDYTFIDDCDVLDTQHAFVTGRVKFRDEYDLGLLLDTRSRRQIAGDFTITPLDIYNKRTYPDTVVLSRSNFDTHGYTVHPVFFLKPPDQQTLDAFMPWRCFLPQNLDGILVEGLAISAHRDAMPILRMQPCIQNQGYALGLAAVQAVAENQPLRCIDIKALQKRLVEIGNLPPEVLEQGESYPIPFEQLREAVASLVLNYEGVSYVLASPDEALPMLLDAFAAAIQPEHRLIYAHTLAMLGNAAGFNVLLDKVTESSWDEGWNFKGMGQFGPSMSRLDSLIVALGETKDKRALPVLMEKTRQLGPDSAFSHIRAIALALESLGDGSAAEPLAELLNKSGMTGHSIDTLETSLAHLPPSSIDTTTRNDSLKELVLARTLYLCGDKDGLGEAVLRKYSKDLRGHYARHASAVLRQRPQGALGSSPRIGRKGVQSGTL